MLTTKDIELKEVKNRKVKIISTKTVDAKQFKVKGKPKSAEKGPTITTANYEKLLKKRKKK